MQSRDLYDIVFVNVSLKFANEATKSYHFKIISKHFRRQLCTNKQ